MHENTFRDGRQGNPRAPAGWSGRVAGCYRFAVNFPPFRTYPLRWIAPAAALAGVTVTLAQRLDPMQNPDSIAFMALARSVLEGHGLRYQEPLIPGLDLYAFRAPGYPLFLAAVTALGGTGLAVAAQGALNGLSAALLGDVALRLGGGPAAAWIAFAMRLLWFKAWWYSGLLLSETLFEFLGVLATWLALRAAERRAAPWAAGAGAVTAWAVLCRPVGLGLALAIGAWLTFRFPRGAAAFALAAVLLWAPWPVRNALVLGAPVPFTTNGGGTAWAGTTDGNVRPAYDWMGAHVHLGELGFDRHFRDLARDNIRRAPGAALRATAQRAFVYLGPIRGRTPELWLHRFAMVMALVALGLAAARARLVLPGAIWAAQGAMMAPIFLIDRYRFPTDWCVVLAAAIGITALADRLGPRRAALATGAALAACVAGSWLLSLGARTG